MYSPNPKTANEPTTASNKEYRSVVTVAEWLDGSFESQSKH
jgi:hypothetical protein